jgi:hypothetical protein
MNKYLVHPQLYAFSDVPLRWNWDVTQPTVDEVIVHPGLAGIPTIFEVRAHDRVSPAGTTPVGNGVFEIRLYIDGNLVDNIEFDRMRGRNGEYPFQASDYYYCTAGPCTPSGSNIPNQLRYKLVWPTEVGNHIWRIDVYDVRRNLLHGDPHSGLPGNEPPSVSLGGTISNGMINVTWRISSADIRDAGLESFSLWEKESRNGKFERVVGQPVPALVSQEVYAFAGDAPGGAGMDSVWYRLTATNTIGSTFFLGEAGIAVPAVANLLAGYPNPMSDRYLLSLSLSHAEVGDVSVFDLHGRRVRVLRHGVLKGGVRRLVWDARDDEGRPVPNGIYLLKVSTEHGPVFSTRKIALYR